MVSTKQTSFSLGRNGVRDNLAGGKKPCTILGCRKLVECVLLYPFRWFFAFYALPLRFARAWHSVTVSKRREGGFNSQKRIGSHSAMPRCFKGNCFACTFGCGGRIWLLVWRLDLHFSSFKNDVSQTKRGSSSKNELGWPASLWRLASFKGKFHLFYGFKSFGRLCHCGLIHSPC